MEDILASIRRILNDDETPADGQHPAPAAAAGTADDVFLLDQTMLIEEPVHMAPEEPFAPEHPMPQPESLPPYVAAAPQGALEPAPEPAPKPAQATHEPLMGHGAASAASASMGALVRVVGQQQTPVYRGGPTLEDMVRDEIRPLVKAWLDENLPPMVERMVRAEIARVSGSL
jgi:cell pole-organizing protein PopZ